MHFAVLLTLAAASVTTLANPVQHPRRADGVYIGDVSADGTTSFKLKAPLKSRSYPSRGELQTRKDYKGVGCDIMLNGGAGLDAFDTDRAVQSVKDYCALKSDDCKHRPAMAQSGDVVAFFCWWREGAEYNVDSFSNALGMITDQCGAYQAGSYSDKPDDSRTYSYGYANWRTHSYCGRPAGKGPNDP